MKLRKCTFADWEFLLFLRNDKATRENSLNQDPVREAEHCSWLRQSLDNPCREIFILEGAQSPLAMIREDRHAPQSNEITLSWAVSSHHRGKGIGTQILGNIVTDRVETFHAEIRDENVPSIRMAEKNGFSKSHPTSSGVSLYKKRGFYEIISGIERVRSTNNVNWMNILRLAFKHTPTEAKQMMGKVNESDQEISKLLKELSGK
tara:strand:+ start:5568 stop:6182 length:615 start_codon:yes stop_codon:yes gene_type:complete